MKEDKLDLDEIISELGSWGRFQMINFAVIMVPIVLSAIYRVQYIFVAGDLIYRCKVPECENFPFTYEPGNWSTFALPPSKEEDHIKEMRCHRWEPIGQSCSADSFTQKSVYCDSWVYKTNNTCVYTYDLACDELKRTCVGSVGSLGVLFSLPLTSYVSDRFGRKIAFIICAFFNGIICLIRSYSINYCMHLVFEFLNTMLGSGVYGTGFILCLEMVHVSHRVTAGSVLSCLFAVGQVILALMAYLLPNWRTLLRAVAIPSLFFFAYFFMVNESVRFLLAKARHKEAVAILKKVAKINKVTFSPEVQSKLDNYELHMDTKNQSALNVDQQKETLIHLMKSITLLKRLGICGFWWITATFIYYGVSINSVSLTGNMYVNFTLMALVEVPGYILTVPSFNYLGRKRTLMTSFFICGLGLIIFSAIPSDNWGAILTVLVSKLMISLSYNGIYIYTIELFPTVVRHRALSGCSIIGRVGSTLAPLSPIMILVWEPLPYTVFGVCAFIAATLLLLTPETNKKKLPDTIEEAEAL